MTRTEPLPTPTGDGTAPRCPEPTCGRPLGGWAGPGTPLPMHYRTVPGVGAPCPEPTHPRCTPCATLSHTQCTGQGCTCTNVTCAPRRRNPHA